MTKTGDGDVCSGALKSLRSAERKCKLSTSSVLQAQSASSSVSVLMWVSVLSVVKGVGHCRDLTVIVPASKK